MPRERCGALSWSMTCRHQSSIRSSPNHDSAPGYCIAQSSVIYLTNDKSRISRTNSQVSPRRWADLALVGLRPQRRHAPRHRCLSRRKPRPSRTSREGRDRPVQVVPGAVGHDIPEDHFSALGKGFRVDCPKPTANLILCLCSADDSACYFFMRLRGGRLASSRVLSRRTARMAQRLAMARIAC